MTTTKAAERTSTRIVTALNRGWTAIQSKHPEVPDVMITTGRKRHKSEASTRGSHCRDAWHHTAEDNALAEVWISGERLADGGAQVMQTLLHEAAHALAQARSLNDTSNKNRYHNKTFVKLAEELGLEGPDASAGTTLGYSNCTITEYTKSEYEHIIAELTEACRNYVKQAPAEVKVKTPVLYAYCACMNEDIKITWTKKLAKQFEETGFFPLMCSVCRQVFVPEGEDRPKDGSNWKED